jgi:hypothetical protein
MSCLQKQQTGPSGKADIGRRDWDVRFVPIGDISAYE